MMRVLGALFLIVVASAILVSQASASTLPQHLAIPSYIYPGAPWSEMAQGALTVSVSVINPASGPGTAPNVDYVNQVKQSQAANLTVLGYVHTGDGNGSISLATAEAEVDEYYSWYGVGGIFFDEVSTDCSVESAYYAPLYAYVKAKGGKAIVALNPGTATNASSCYLSASDILVTFEGDYATYTAPAYSQPSWVATAAPDHIWHLVHDTPTIGDMLQAVNLSKQRNAGWIYVTPGLESGNTWGSLPPRAYWEGELAAVNAGPGLVNVQTNAGAKGDGVTDDTAALQSGLQQLGAVGGVLYVPSATYLIHPSALAVPSNVAVVGDAAVLKNGALGFSAFDVQSGASNVGVTGVAVDGNNLAIRGMTIGSGATSVLIAADTFQNFTQPTDPTSGLYNDVPVGIRIEGNGSGIVIDSTTVQNVVAINTNGPSWPHKVARGIWLDTTGAQTIAKNVSIRNGSIDNVAPKDDGDCIVVQDSTDTANLTIDNNTFDNCHKRAIKLQVPGVTVTNNRITNPFLNNNFFDTYPGPFPYDMYSAIAVYATNVTVAGNTVSGVGSFYADIEVGAAACSPLGNVTIQNNSLQSGSATELSASVIRAFAPVNGFTVTGNVLAYATNGITAFPLSSNVVTSPNSFGPDITNQITTYGTPCDTTPPVVSDVVANPVPLNTVATVTATITDPTGLTGAPPSGVAATFYTVDSGAPVAMSAQADSAFNSSSVAVTATFPGFSTTGVHNVCVSGTDVAGNVSASQCALLAIYDPRAGFVTGGGWINSPTGAYTPNPTVTGQANFGFVSKYEKGATVPSGETEFHFQVANLDFHSTSYQWLVIAGDKAQYKGIGTINGSGTYGFILTAIDGDVNGGAGPDRFRIKIWDATQTADGSSGAIYDNQLGASDTADPSTAIGGGSIVIHD